MRLHHWLATLALMPLFLASVSATTLAILFRAPLVGLTGLLLGLAFFPLMLPRTRRPRLRLVFVCSAVLAAVLLHVSQLSEIQRGLDRLSVKLDNNPGGPGGRDFSTSDKLSVYLFGLFMGVGGTAVYPEVAREHLMLYIPGPSVRRWDSDFAMSAEGVRSPLSKFAQSLERRRNDAQPVVMEPVSVTFSYGRDPDRVALALNPIELHAEANKGPHGWVIRVSGFTPIEYPPHSRVSVPLPVGGPLEIEEGLFWVLQDSGWLFPYTAEWRWEIHWMGRPPLASDRRVVRFQSTKRAAREKSRHPVDSLGKRN